MNRTLYLAIAIIALTAAISITLSLIGYPLPADGIQTLTRRIVTTPLLWAIFSAAMTAYAVSIVNKKPAQITGKSKMISNIKILYFPLLFLCVQVLLPLKIHGVIGGDAMQYVMFAINLTFFMSIGNYVSTVKPNGLGGLRTQWTLADPVVWAKTQRFYGRGIVMSSLAAIPLAFFGKPEMALWALVAGFMAALIISRAYSHRIANEKSA
ncbi:MAG: hypothetical protein COA69_12155 [Robiginitomaculum sp.]|nr:MAG: hypothetical protein COA69_12155 [Robiginitomaculum sp.]